MGAYAPPHPTSASRMLRHQAFPALSCMCRLGDVDTAPTTVGVGGFMVSARGVLHVCCGRKDYIYIYIYIERERERRAHYK
jgi:hypothetical protein